MRENRKGIPQGNPEEQRNQDDDISILAGIAESFDRSVSLQALSPYVAQHKGLIESEKIEDWHAIVQTLSAEDRSNLTAGLNLLLRKGYASVGRVRGLTLSRMVKLPFMGPKRAKLIKELFPTPQE